jgi:MFS family permease
MSSIKANASLDAVGSGRFSSKPSYFLFLLTSAYFLSFFDRQLLIIMIENVKRDLHVSDTQFSLLYGFAFTAMYAGLGLFFGQAVDKLPRTRLLAVAILIWSLATGACGLAQNFEQLFLARMAVGVGEGALAPAAFSILADLYSPARRTRAFSIYAIGIYIGGGLALVVGGHLVVALAQIKNLSLPIVGHVRSWQLAFFVATVPGMLLALALGFAREPLRGGQAHLEARGGAASAPHASYVAHFLANRRAYLSHHLGFGLHTGLAFALAVWLPAVFLRVHHWAPGKAGLVFGVTSAIAGILGALSGGAIIDRLVRLGLRDAPLRVCAINCLLCPVAIAIAALSSFPPLAVSGAAVAYFLVAVTAAPAAASLQTITPAPLRGRASAVFFLVSQMVGVTLVPLCVALVTERVFHSPMAVDRSLVVVAFATMAPAAVLLWSAKSLFRVEDGDNPGPVDEVEGLTPLDA